MTPEEMELVRPRPAAFAHEMLGGFARADQRVEGELYLRGLMLDGKRKSMQPMAARLGVDHQQLQQFVTTPPRTAPGCAAGLPPGGVVAVLLDNSAEFVAAHHGVLAAGGVVLALDPRDPAERRVAEITACDAVAAVADAARSERLIPAGPLTVVPAADVATMAATWPEPAVGDELPERGGDLPAVLGATSGTSGAAKRLVLTHRNLVAGLAQTETLHRVRGDDVVLPIGPPRHIYAMQMASRSSPPTT